MIPRRLSPRKAAESEQREREQRDVETEQPQCTSLTRLSVRFSVVIEKCDISRTSRRHRKLETDIQI